MAQKYETPEGYMPYRLFTYKDGPQVCILRPEQFIGIVASHTHGIAIHVHLKDSVLTMHFGSAQSAGADADRFTTALTQFLEDDALRNAHNAVMRKGKMNAPTLG